MKRRDLTAGTASILFAAVIGVRATAFLFSKLLLVDMGPFMLMGMRFLLAFAILFVMFRANMRAMTRSTFVHGLVLGVLFFVVMGFELVSLTMAASSTVAFLENTAIVFVPLIEALVARKLPTLKEVACTVVVMVGGVDYGTLRRTGVCRLAHVHFFACFLGQHDSSLKRRAG